MQNYTRIKSFISHEKYVKAFAKPRERLKREISQLSANV